MRKKKIRVMVVDDSAVLRERISDIIGGSDGLEVAGSARDGMDALEKLPQLQPDIVTLDVHMPRMDGLETLDAILADRPLPVIMVSALTSRAAGVTLDALERGAVDYVTKPDSFSGNPGTFGQELVHKLRTMAGADVRRLLQIRRNRKKRVLVKQQTATTRTFETIFENCCVAIGISTGGPPALSSLLETLTPPLPPMVIVQHMPANFTGPFSRRLNALSELSVKEAEAGDVLCRDHVFVAPGGRHLRLGRKGANVILRIVDRDPVSGHKPSIDVMMADVAQQFGERCLGVIMTGMGHDGSEGCGLIRSAGGFVLGQDELSSDVYGMNKVAFTAGNVDRQFSLDELPAMLTSQCRRMFQVRSAVGTSDRV